MSAHENLEHVEHAEHASHGGNKKIALLISVLALFLAFSETLGKSAQTHAIALNVEANDLWAFFQAKTIRMTVLSTAAEQMQIEADRATDPELKTRLTKKIDEWKKLVARYDDEPSSNEGRKQLMARARDCRASSRPVDGALPQLRDRLGRLSRSASCWRRRRSSPAWSCSAGRPACSAWSGSCFTGVGLWAPHALHFITG